MVASFFAYPYCCNPQPRAIIVSRGILSGIGSAVVGGRANTECGAPEDKQYPSFICGKELVPKVLTFSVFRYIFIYDDMSELQEQESGKAGENPHAQGAEAAVSLSGLCAYFL